MDARPVADADQGIPSRRVGKRGLRECTPRRVAKQPCGRDEAAHGKAQPLELGLAQLQASRGLELVDRVELAALWAGILTGVPLILGIVMLAGSEWNG